MLRVENVRCGGIVNDDSIPKVTPELREILDVIAVMVIAAFAEQTVMNNVVNVELVKQWVAVLQGISFKTH